jgi:hypothetical protein
MNAKLKLRERGGVGGMGGRKSGGEERRDGGGEVPCCIQEAWGQAPEWPWHPVGAHVGKSQQVTWANSKPAGS